MVGDIDAFVEIIRDLRRLEQRLHRLEIGQGGEGSGLPSPSGTYSLLYSSNDYNASYDEWDGELEHPSSADYTLLTTASAFSWIDATTAWPAPGNDTEIIYNNSGVLAGATDLEYESGDLVIEADSKALKLGAGKDMDIYYDGTDGYIRTDVVAASDLNIDCGTNKTIELQTTVYRDINLGAAVNSLPVASQPDEVQFVDEGGTNTGIYSYGFAVGEKISGAFELQHDYQEGTDLTFHIHWTGDTAPTGTDNVQWQLTYTVGQTGQTLDAVATLTVETGYDTQYEFAFSSFAAITGTNFDIGDQFLFTVERIAASADEYGGDAKVSTMGIHYQVNTLGSRQIATK